MIQKRKKKYYESLKRAEAGKYQLLSFVLDIKHQSTNFFSEKFIYIQWNHLSKPFLNLEGALKINLTASLQKS